MKKLVTRGLAALASLAGIGLIAGAFLAPDIEIAIPEPQVQEMIAAKMPMKVQKSGVTVNIHDLQVDFLGSNKVAVEAEFSAEGYTLEGEGRLAATSGLRYAAGNFYLTDLDVGDISMHPSDKSSERLADGKTLALGLMDKMRDKIAGNDAVGVAAFDRVKKDALGKLELAAAERVDAMLAQTPVYSLNDKGMKESLAAAALKDIKFTETQADVTLSPSQLIQLIIGTILIFAAATVLGLGIMLGGGGAAVVAAGL